MKIEEIKKILKKKGITYEQLSQMSGISVSAIKKIFSGVARYPRIDTVQAIEKALGITDGITAEEYAQGARYTKMVSITADQEDVLDKYKEVEELLGEKGKELVIEFCDMLVEKFKKN